jgi:hypothetical protein
VSDLDHPAWPLRFETRPNGTVTFAAVAQDTDAERKANAAVIAATPRGAHLGDPAFGVTTPLFEAVPLDVERLAREIAQSDPRLDLTVTDTIDLLNAAARTLTVAIGPAQAAAEGP